MAEQRGTESEEAAQQVIAALGSLVKILGTLAGILERMLTTVVARPDLLENIIRTLSSTVAIVGKTAEKTVPGVGEALGSAVGGTVSEVGKTVEQTVGAVSEVGRPVGEVVEGIGRALDGTGKQERVPEGAKSQEDIIKELLSKSREEVIKELMSRSKEELQAIYQALETKKKTA